ncbi:MAG: hypothetical protein A2X36_03680 [Elusimicrobia bacterium GWA2_69_24]|nr:MAG: hypothetical protein A2X36_03680 [Elusimicrobia bacterium GWA2_69_24]HBL16662.1 hypothetical protein [Elusimicrobiota bacterium]
MPFIATDFSGKGDDPEKKKKKDAQVEELSVEAGQEKERKTQLNLAYDQLRKKELALEEQFRARVRQVEADVQARVAAEFSKMQTAFNTAAVEAQERGKLASREQMKAQLLEQQIKASQERIVKLEMEVRQAQRLAQDATAAGARVADSAVSEERRKTRLTEDKLKNTDRRLAELEKQLAAAQLAARAAAAAPGAAPGAAGPAGAGLPGAPAKTPFPAPVPGEAPKAEPPLAAPVGDMQARFNEIVNFKAAPDSNFLGMSRKPAAEDPDLIVKIVQFIMEEAARSRSSDIHLEPMEEGMRVRFRIDGILSEMLRFADTRKYPVISRIRVMCGLDPEQGMNTAKPQEGRMVVNVDGRDIDLRLSTFPTNHGDKAVLRLIHRTAKKFALSELGFSPKITETIQRLIERPQGMILVTGPAGSGKSTTLYTFLQALNSPTRNIVTLEDPVEMKLPGINQCNVQPKIGFTFAEGLHSILRQDPNVIMVGEIRDRATAEIAMSASLTGHLLLTTLHTNSAAGAVTRLLDMGLEPYLIASSVAAVFAQRLVRKICKDCKEGYHPTKAELDELHETSRKAGVTVPAGEIKFFRGKGCKSCRGSGYQGRQLLFEVLQQFPGFRQMILQKATFEDIQVAAIKAGMESLGGHGLTLVRAGETTLEELLRVVGARD